MKFGIFSVVDHYPNDSSRTLAKFYDELLEQAEAADSLGFSSFWIAEHHFHEYGGVPRPPIWLAAAAQRTRRLRLGSAVVVLPFDNPLRTAEDYAMVDVLSNGRLSLGVGSGYLSHEYAGFGINPDTKRERFDEALAIILKAWEGKRFSYRGKYHSVENVKLNVVPVQKPRPEISIAVLRNEAARFVATQGLSLMMIPYATSEQTSELAETVRIYKEELEHGVASGGVRFAVHTFCAQATGQARTTGGEAMDLYVRTRLYAKQRPMQSLIDKDLVAIGDVAEVLRVARLYQSMGVDEFLAITNFGALPHKDVLKSMQLIGEQIIPELRTGTNVVSR